MADASALESLFFAALKLGTPAEQAAYLDSVCGTDAELRRQLEKLLKAHLKVGDFLQNPAGAQFTSTPALFDATETLGEAERDDEGTGLEILEASTRPDSLGRIGHYEVLQILGKGGFGIVFRAFDDVLQRIVALKVLAPAIAATSPARKRFLREARSSARVRHENVVQIHAVEEKPLPYLVMEFIPGETLQERLDRSGPLETAEMVRLGRQIAEGLAAAHATGLIHRDIKPGNVLIEPGPHGHIKITDFGLARAADDASLTQSGTLAGTPMYMAPEQAQGHKLDHRADLFSLGSVLYVMATGRPPFRAPTTFAVLKRVVEDAPRPIQEVIPETPRWLCDIIARLHAKNPDDRYSSASEVAALFAHCQTELQSSGNVSHLPVRTPTAPEETPTTEDFSVRDFAKAAPAPRPARRMRRWVAAAAVFLFLLVGLGFTEATGVTNLSGTVIRLFSSEGTLVVEVDDPAVSVKIDGSDVVITGAGAREIRLTPGKYTVEASKAGKIVSRELVTVTKNGKQVVRVSQEAALARKDDPDVKGKSADAASWERVVAGLPAEQQLAAVSARLKELNPNFDGVLVPAIQEGVVTGLEFKTDYVTDISPVRALTRLRSLTCRAVTDYKGQLTDLSPLRGLPLTHLDCVNNVLHDLKPLEGMKLVYLHCDSTKVTDLSPLRGMPLEDLSCGFTKIADLSPLKGLKLTIAVFSFSEVSDLTPLKGMPLTSLACGVTKVSDLSPLKDMKLESLEIDETKVSDLAPLKGMKLKGLYCRDTKVVDLSPLKGMPLSDLFLGSLVTDLSPVKGMPVIRFYFGAYNAERDAAIMRAIPTLTEINGKSPAEFWK